MRIEQLESLDENELAVLCAVVNSEPKILSYDISSQIILTINHNALIDRIKKSEDKIDDKYKDSYKSLRTKLDCPTEEKK